MPAFTNRPCWLVTPAEVDQLSDGRLELGLGAGYVREEFEAAELPYPTARQRVDYLEHVTTYVKKHLPGVPILVAGNGNRLLTVAAEHADIIGLTGANPGHAADPLAERIEFVRSAAGDRFADLELNLAITAVPSDNSGKPDLSLTRRFVDLSDEELLALPSVLSGSPREIADTLRGYRDKYGLTSFTFQENHVDTIAKVIRRVALTAGNRSAATCGFRMVDLMRYNPPPNWPKPPKGWAPHADWSPDPAWPPPPPGWRLWVEEEAPGAQPTSRRWDDSGTPATTANISGTTAPGPRTPGLRLLTTSWMPRCRQLPPQPTEVAPEDLAVQHLGQYATVKWDDDQQYAIGTIVAVSADAAAVRLKLDGIEAPVSFPRVHPAVRAIHVC